MLKKLIIKNFKSLQESEITLGKFNVMVGKNGSGKSNILQCLRFLSQIPEEDLNQLLEKFGKFTELVYGGNTELCIDISLETEKESYFLSLNKDNNNPTNQETLKTADIDLFSLTRKDFASELKYKSKTGQGSISGGQIFSGLYNLRQNDIDLQIEKFRKYIKSWSFYKFETSKIRKSLKAQRTFHLAEDGSNLAQVLLSLHNEKPKIFNRIEDTLKLLIEDIDELLTPLTENGETYIAFHESGFENNFNYNQISDGTLELLAFITATNLDSSLLCIEEPENFIHPYLLRSLVEILKQSDKQIILTTHSPYLLDFIDIEDLIVLEKNINGTKARRIDKDEDKERIRDLLNNEISFGELYYSGSI